ncbi:MFS transporter [Ktedonobacter sp. SOSP1-52]|uniref:MFS transporter n=1 Tax=Ktedonobacter sp. SOSP1-52 TaxID=2778366 RepID=UPI001915A283|nr:MFS transporter [Ktedonobacter sp. SOSP1-52]GHO70492.1 MFS transporter [Ktedonobacter sp. SOSP1-52]
MITTPTQQTIQQTKTQTMMPLLALCLGYFMTILDVTIVNVALVDIKEHLSANVTGLQWIVDGYALVFASLLLTGGALGDRRGSRTIFLVGFALFTLASTLCSLAPTLLVLQIARAFQGLGAALLVPNSLALLNTLSTSAHKRAQAIGIWAAVASIGALSGPLLGGFLVNAFGWRSIFLINLPIGILGFLLTLRSIAPSTPKTRRSLDLPGQVAGMLALGLLTFALIEGNSLGILSLPILVAYAASALFFLLFLWREKIISHPMLPLNLFHERTFSATNVVALCQTFTFTGFIFVISLYLQEVQHYSPSLTGLALLPSFGCALLATSFSGMLMARIGTKRVMVMGLIFAALGCFGVVLLVQAHTTYLLLACLITVLGGGLALVLPAMTNAAMSHAPRSQSGIASAMLNVSRQVGGVIGVAILGTLVGNQQSFVSGMHLAFVIAGGVLVLGLVVAWRLVSEQAKRYPQSDEIAGKPGTITELTRDALHEQR